MEFNSTLKKLSLKFASKASYSHPALVVLFLIKLLKNASTGLPST